MKAINLPMLAALAGCATLPPQQAASAEVRRLVLKSADELRELVGGLSDPAAVPDYATVRVTLDEARSAVAAQAALNLGAGLGDKAGLAAMGVTLHFCAEGVDRLERGRIGVTEFRLGCLGPLALAAGG